jgi:ectoine hydroxylase-related dioxygenase (phytanoyl-CoA dioxygenase family)
MKMQEKALVTTPELLKPGTLLVYDYRVVHAGGANASDARRALGYAMFVRDDAPSDTWNFPMDESIFA